ncbi:hypothetical protein IG611_01345 [Pectobacterium sp. A535-S3-A17]|uniref:hypothetical protein n=1 Tax=Pectobacterium quasiaquaticum TaxID=2774015 RepID=UPI001873A4A2|nr:hypothetical protein [Pectobacterium quasiaquaticum]MBE5213313.1 hypothetical protein [Pectobacterium quasiaquaticum]MBE5224037.1 hypothetical protein [Pectobacterium quasiaquaticum]
MSQLPLFALNLGFVHQQFADITYRDTGIFGDHVFVDAAAMYLIDAEYDGLRVITPCANTRRCWWLFLGAIV